MTPQAGNWNRMIFQTFSSGTLNMRIQISIKRPFFKVGVGWTRFIINRVNINGCQRSMGRVSRSPSFWFPRRKLSNDGVAITHWFATWR